MNFFSRSQKTVPEVRAQMSSPRIVVTEQSPTGSLDDPLNKSQPGVDDGCEHNRESVPQDAHCSIAPRPATIEQTGVSLQLLEDLLARILFETGVTDVEALTSISALSGPVVGELLESLRADSCIEVRSPLGASSALRYTLTDIGKKFAKDAYERSGYIGPAPVPLQLYTKILKQQTVRQHRISQSAVMDAYSDVTISTQLVNQLGSAMHSRKAVFVYGKAGTGKTFVCNKLARLLGDPVLVPNAVVVGESIVKIFDPMIHKSVGSVEAEKPLLIANTFDSRFKLCERPFVCSGGELSADLLEVQYDAATRQYNAPLQLKASNGIYLIDDLGRQKIPTAELFNRWIVPMESGEDYLNLQSGDRMVVPFDLILIFSTNLDPNDLADAAFLRRIGHKIRFETLNVQEYSAIWAQVCSGHNIPFEQHVVDYVIDQYHRPTNTDLLPCHPRDLVGSALDYIDFMQLPRQLDTHSIDMAWKTNFVMAEYKPNI